MSEPREFTMTLIIAEDGPCRVEVSEKGNRAAKATMETPLSGLLGVRECLLNGGNLVRNLYRTKQRALFVQQRNQQVQQRRAARAATSLPPPVVPPPQITGPLLDQVVEAYNAAPTQQEADRALQNAPWPNPQVLLPSDQGGHDYPGCRDPQDFFTSDCEYGCGCWMGAARSGGPDGIDPFGKCTNNIPATEAERVQMGADLAVEQGLISQEAAEAAVADYRELVDAEFVPTPIEEYGVLWCDSCHSYHHPDNPSCFAKIGRPQQHTAMMPEKLWQAAQAIDWTRVRVRYWDTPREQWTVDEQNAWKLETAARQDDLAQAYPERQQQPEPLFTNERPVDPYCEECGGVHPVGVHTKAQTGDDPVEGVDTCIECGELLEQAYNGLTYCAKLTCGQYLPPRDRPVPPQQRPAARTPRSPARSRTARGN